MSLVTKWFWVTADRLADLGTLVMDLWPPGQARAPEARRDRTRRACVSTCTVFDRGRTTVNSNEIKALPDLVTVAEAARLLRASEQYVRRMCKAGDLPAVKVGRAWRINKTDLLYLAGIAPDK